MLFLALYLITFKNSIERGNGLLKLFVPVRFFILLMGFFAFFNGLIYNDFTSLTFNFFGSCYNTEVINKLIYLFINSLLFVKDIK